jgi:hypothetical protein
MGSVLRFRPRYGIVAQTTIKYVTNTPHIIQSLYRLLFRISILLIGSAHYPTTCTPESIGHTPHGRTKHVMHQRIHHIWCILHTVGVDRRSNPKIAITFWPVWIHTPIPSLHYRICCTCHVVWAESLKHKHIMYCDGR